MTKIIREAGINGQLRGRDKQISTRWVVAIDDKLYPIFIKPIDQGYNVRFERTRIFVRSNWPLGNNLFHGIVNDKTVSVKINQTDAGYNLSHAGVKVLAKVRLPRVAELEQLMQVKNNDSSLESVISAPISGKIVEVKVKVGDVVKAGQELMLIEAMKMENVIYATKEAKVDKIYFQAGDLVNVGQDIIELA